MFFIEGWLTIHEVYWSLRKFRRSHPDLEAYPENEHPFSGLGRKAFLADFFGLCMSCDRAGILLHNGQVILADRFFLFSFSVEDGAHRFFSIPEGIVGQGSLSEKFALDKIEASVSKRSTFYNVLSFAYTAGRRSGTKSSMKESIGEHLEGFVGARVIFSERDVQDYLNAMAGDKPEPVSEKRCAALLVAAFDRGELVNKVTAKQDFAPNLGQRAFLRAWQMATAERPELSRPGRPKLRS